MVRTRYWDRLAISGDIVSYLSKMRSSSFMTYIYDEIRCIRPFTRYISEVRKDDCYYTLNTSILEPKTSLTAKSSLELSSSYNSEDLINDQTDLKTSTDVDYTKYLPQTYTINVRSWIINLEKTMLYGEAICIYEFLYFITATPINVVASLLVFIGYLFRLACHCLVGVFVPYKSDTTREEASLSVTNMKHNGQNKHKKNITACGETLSRLKNQIDELDSITAPEKHKSCSLSSNQNFITKLKKTISKKSLKANKKLQNSFFSGSSSVCSQSSNVSLSGESDENFMISKTTKYYDNDHINKINLSESNKSAELKDLNRKVVVESTALIRASDLYSILHTVILIIIVLLYRRFVDSASFYHYLRQQSLIKLYVLYNMLDLAMRAWRSLERDAFNTVFKTFLSEIYVNKGGKYIDVGKLVSQFSLACSVVFIDTMFNLARSLLLCMALLFTQNTLSVLLFSANWVEIKSTIFKKQTEESIFVLVCSDIIERFYYIIDSVLAIYYAFSANLYTREYTGIIKLSKCIFLLLLLEIFVDCLKFIFLIKLNHLPNTIIKMYRRVFSLDIIASRSPTVLSLLNLEKTPFPVSYIGQFPFPHISSNRIGLNPIAIYPLFIPPVLAVYNGTGVSSKFVLLFVWLSLYCLQLLLGMLLFSIALKNYDEIGKLNDRNCKLSSL